MTTFVTESQVDLLLRLYRRNGIKLDDPEKLEDREWVQSEIDKLIPTRGQPLSHESLDDLQSKYADVFESRRDPDVR